MKVLTIIYQSTALLMENIYTPMQYLAEYHFQCMMSKF